MSDRPELNAERFDELMDEVMEGAATPEQIEQLNACLRHDAEARARYIAYLDLHAALADPAGPLSHRHETDLDDDRADIMREVVASALAERRKQEVEDEAGRRLAAQQAEDARNRRYELRRFTQSGPKPRVVVIPKAVVWLGLAAVLGLVAWIGWPKADSPAPAQPPTAREDKPRDGRPAHHPVYVASVGETYRAVWANGPTRGRLVRGEAATLLEGYAELVFDDGARVVVRAPAVIEPLGPNAMRLASGILTAEVPESAHGFEVHTPQMLVTDLGTAFGVEVTVAAEVTEAFVFDGLIEVSAPSEAGSENTQAAIPMSAGQSVRGVEGRELESQTMNPGRFIRDVGSAPYAVEGSETVCFLEEAPRSLMPGVLESNDWVHVILEQASAQRGEAAFSGITQPGMYQSFTDGGQEISHRGAVDSYLVHFDPVGSQESAYLSGSITFPRPVVAVLADESGLAQTDRWFAHPTVQLFRDIAEPFGLDGAENPTTAAAQIDWIELSEDRKTIRFRLHALRPCDEFRVLIEAAEVSP